MLDEQVYNIALGLTSGVGSALSRQLISYCGSAKQVLNSTRGKLLKIPGIGPKTAEALLNKENIYEAEKEYNLAQDLGVQVLFYTDERFPKRLKAIDDAPTLLYFKGNVDLNSDKIVGIVGTRKSTAYGKSITEEIVSELAAFQSIIVVSGLAYGIDVTAHKAALKYDVPTLGIMASGIDIVYPSAHKGTALQMLEKGGLLTEYKLGTKPDAPFFPARNRIIAGIVDALIVVEAAATGGALITADIANSYNKDVFAVPGNVGSTYSEGCNLLVRNHKATIFTGVKDLKYFMNWEENAPSQKSVSAAKYDYLEGEEKQIIALLQQSREMLIDELSWKSQIPLSKLAALLLNLELQGLIKVLPGKKFTLV